MAARLRAATTEEKIMKTLFLLLGALVLASAATAQTAPPATATLEVKFEAIEVPSGQVMVSLFDNEAAHDGGGKWLRAVAVKVTGPTASARFEGLTPGRYAIKAFHDIDGDGEMKTNPFGMPLEPFAFSNNAKPEGGPAKWQEASFDVPAGASATSIIIQ
jgi:uncharacterized protein (DUF2141 family)